MLFDGFMGAIIGAVVGALLTATVSWWIFRSQGREDRAAAAMRSAEEKGAAARLQRNDVARAAHLLIAEYQDKVLAIIGRAVAIEYATKYSGNLDAPEDVSKATADLVSLSDGKDIIIRLEQCCPDQKIRMFELEDKKMKEIPNAYSDVSTLFGVCMDLSEGLTSIRNDLANMIREV
jgi:hypothetical protein